MGNIFDFGAELVNVSGMIGLKAVQAGNDLFRETRIIFWLKSC